MTFVKLAAPALAWLAFASAAPADARVSIPVTDAASIAAPRLVDDKAGERGDDQRRDDQRDGEDGDDEETDDLDMMDMGDDEGDDEPGGRSDDDDDGRRKPEDERRNEPARADLRLQTVEA